jgi:hypothetical protein|tara:strand:+ start:155 stop:361 length:207 start_codon:yes stop_codon:yes gene_type:complete
MVQQHLQQKVVDTADTMEKLTLQDQSNQDQEMNGEEVEKVDQVEEILTEPRHLHQLLVLEYNQHKIQV